MSFYQVVLEDHLWEKTSVKWVNISWKEEGPFIQPAQSPNLFYPKFAAAAMKIRRKRDQSQRLWKWWFLGCRAGSAKVDPARIRSKAALPGAQSTGQTRCETRLKSLGFWGLTAVPTRQSNAFRGSTGKRLDCSKTKTVSTKKIILPEPQKTFKHTLMLGTF